MQPKEKYHHILSLIEKELTLPYLPAIAVQILDAVQKNDAALSSELEEIISIDPVLMTKMLKVANSGVFACNGEITNVKQGMSMLGADIIKNIALSFVIVAELNNNEHTDFDFDHFWRRSVTAAVSAELLSKTLQYKNDDIFVSALLHDLGMLVISLTKGNEYNTLLKEARLSDIDLIDLEKDKYGFNHQQVGYALLTSWHLPDSVSEPILYHHQPESTPETCRKSAEILYLADQLSAICNEPETAEKARLLQQRLVEHFSVDETQALKLLDAAATNSCEMIGVFELDPGDIKPYSLLLKEANTEFEKLHLSNDQMVLEMKEAKEKAERLAHELQDANSHLKKLVYRDGLTGLYNHRYFQESLGNELARAARYNSSVSLILFNIDFFKKVNDSYGYPAGDLILINIANAVNSSVRFSDIVARYGGNEFAVILPETNTAGVKVFAARVRRCIEGIATLVEGQLIYVTISVGATTYSMEQSGVTKNILIETANRGLYLSKKNGRNQVTILKPELSDD